MTGITLPANTTLTVEDVTETLTGYEENEVEDRFGADFNLLSETKPIMAMRALVYIVCVRELREAQVKDEASKAYKHVMSLTMRQVGEFFPDEQDPEPNPAEPVSAEGKDDSPA